MVHSYFLPLSSNLSKMIIIETTLSRMYTTWESHTKFGGLCFTGAVGMRQIVG